MRFNWLLFVSGKMQTHLKILFYIFCVCSIVTSNGARILGVFWFPSLSHQYTFQPIWRELSLRGHQVTVITVKPLQDPTLTNLTEIDVSFLFDSLRKDELLENYSKENWIWNLIIYVKYLKEELVDLMMKSIEIEELIKSNLTFDVIIVEPHNPIVFAFGEKFKAPVIG